MQGNDGGDINITDAVAIRQTEGVIILNITGDVMSHPLTAIKARCAWRAGRCEAT